jgi:hypothetical protein
MDENHRVYILHVSWVMSHGIQSYSETYYIVMYAWYYWALILESAVDGWFFISGLLLLITYSINSNATQDRSKWRSSPKESKRWGTHTIAKTLGSACLLLEIHWQKGRQADRMCMHMHT